MRRLQIAGIIIFSVIGGAAAAMGEFYTAISGRVSGPVLAAIILAPNLYVIWLRERRQDRRAAMPAVLRTAMSGLMALAMTGALAFPARADEPDNSDAYQKAVGSVVYIRAIDADWNMSSGTGVLINAERDEILTAFHVVGRNQLISATVPCREKNGDIITDAKHYGGMNSSDACTVIIRDEGRDLAIIRWKTPHKDLKAIPLAAKSASPGASVFCIGNGADMLFRYSGGSIRTLSDEAYTTTTNQKVNARIVTTSCPIDPGDSGAPLLSRDGSLLGIVSSTRTDLNQIHKSIDISEIRYVVSWYDDYRKKFP